MSREGKTFPNEASARGALNAAHAAWNPPPYVNVGGGRHLDHAQIPPQKLAEPFVLVNGRWAVVADHPSFKGETIEDSDVPPVDIGPQGVGVGVTGRDKADKV